MNGITPGYVRQEARNRVTRAFGQYLIAASWKVGLVAARHELFEAMRAYEATIEERKKEEGGTMTDEMMEWGRGPSGVYQSGRYTLLPIGGGAYAIAVNGQHEAVVENLDRAKNWCGRHRRLLGDGLCGDAEGGARWLMNR